MSDHVDRQFLPPCSFLRAIRSERKEYANQCLKRKIRDCWQSTDHVSCRFIFFLSVVVNLFRILSIGSQLYFSPFVASQLIPFRPPGNCGHFHSVQGSLNYSDLFWAIYWSPTAFGKHIKSQEHPLLTSAVCGRKRMSELFGVYLLHVKSHAQKVNFSP